MVMARSTMKVFSRITVMNADVDLMVRNGFTR